MKRKTRATWTSRKETPLWCLDFSDFAADRSALMAEIEASEAVIQQQAENSLLVAVALHQATMMPELTAFFKRYAGKERNPIRKMAILYVTRWQRIWFRLAHGVTWPQNARFFDDYEKAKDWLVSEQF